MIQSIKRSSLLILTPQTPLTRPYATTLMRDLEACLEMPGIRNFVLDLAEVRETDGTGLGTIVKIATEARAGGRGFYLYRPSEEALKGLRERDLDGFFPTLEYEADLLAHLSN